MPFKVCETPDYFALAVNVPEGGLHGHDQRALQTGLRWAAVRSRARQEIDVARDTIAHALCLEIGHLLWIVNTDGVAVEYDAGELGYIEKYGERDRLRLLGVMALAELAEPIVIEGNVVTDARGLGSTDCMLDIAAGNNMRTMVRLHANTPVVDELLGPTEADGTQDTWYRNEGGLYVRRGPLDLSTNMQTMLSVEDIQITDAPMETLSPYLASKPAA